MIERLQIYTKDLIENHCIVSDSVSFYESLNKSRHPLMLTPYTVSELASLRLYKVIGHDMGFGIKDYGNGKREIVAMHNNDPIIKGIGPYLVQAAIRLGGNRVNHFDIHILNNLYSTAGFVEVSRTPFDPQYDPGGIFEKTYGRLDVIDRELLK